MEAFKTFVIQHWPDILSYFTMGIGYFLILLYRYSTRNLNTNLKTTFKESANTIAETNRLFEDRVKCALKEAQAEYVKAIELCKSYENKIDHLEATLKVFLEDGGE